MEKNLYYQIQDTRTPNRSTLLRFVATNTYPYKNKSLLWN